MLPTSASGSLGACREGRERNGCRLRSGAYSTTWAQGNRQHHLHVGYHLHELWYERGALVVHEVRQHVQMQMTVLVVLAPVVMPASGCKCR